MDPEDTNTSNNPSPTGAPPAAVAQQPAAISMSQEDFEARIAQERNAAAAAARRETEARLRPRSEPPKAQPEPTPPSSSSGLTAEQVAQMMEQERAFDRSVRAHGLNDDQGDALRTLHRVEKPTDLTAWLAAKAALFGKTTHPSSNTQPSHTSPVAPPVSLPSVPAPSTAVPNDGPDDVTRWNESQWEAYVRRNGAYPSNPYHWANHQVHKDLARKFEAAMATKRIITKR